MPIHDWTRVDAGSFHDFHSTWIPHIRHTLRSGLLPPGYYAMVEQVTSGPNPDILTLKHDTIKARRIAIKHVSKDRIVAVIEIVSPGNKASKHVLGKFVSNAVSLIRAGVHLLVVDLFPPSVRDPRGIHPEIWNGIGPDDYEPPADKPLTLASYAAGETEEAFVQPVRVGGVLPAMPVFLTPDEYIDLPLEASYQSAFEDVPDHLQAILKA